MITDRNRPELEWSLSDVRRLLPSSPFTEEESPGVGERLPSVALGRRLPSSGVRERLSAPTLARPSSDLRLSSTALGERLPSPTVGRELSAPPVRLPEPDIVDRDQLEAYVYDSETTTPEYFVGVIPTDHETITEQLRDSEFGLSRVTYPKTLADEKTEPDASSIWVYRSWPLSHFQLHVPLFEVDEGDPVVYVFYHHEYNWLRHPVSHLDAEYLNPDWGCDVVLDLLESAGLTVETCADIDDEYGRATEYCDQCGENT